MTELPSEATTALPGAIVTGSSKRTDTAGGVVASVDPSRGDVETTFAWAKADAGQETATATATRNTVDLSTRRTAPMLPIRCRASSRGMLRSANRDGRDTGGNAGRQLRRPRRGGNRGAGSRRCRGERGEVAFPEPKTGALPDSGKHK